MGERFGSLGACVLGRDMVNDRTSRVIGGMFGLELFLEGRWCEPPFLNDQALYLANARSGIWLVVKWLSPNQVWVPSYLCDAVLSAIRRSGASVKFFAVDYDLAVAGDAWIKDVRRGDLVILIDYFGFLCDPALLIEAKERGAWVLEDACQALLSGGLGKRADFVLFSPRKFLGVPDGGILMSNCEKAPRELGLTSASREWRLRSLSAAILRREFDIHGGNRSWFNMFKQAEKDSPIGPYAMSELSRELLKSVFDYSAIADRRVKNYRGLLRELSHIAVFPELPDNVVPLGFPVRIQNRDQVRQVLFEHDIYPPVHWQTQKIVPDQFVDSHRLGADIMTLPCDQRCDAEDMYRMAQLVLRGLKK